MTERAMNCEMFDERLSDYLEETLDRRTKAQMESHSAICLRCAALAHDLEHIAHEAKELPELVPSRDLWAGIAERIETPVVPISVARPRRRWDLVRFGAIAAGLMAVTAGVTYRLTINQVRADSAAVVTRADTTSGQVLADAALPPNGAPSAAIDSQRTPTTPEAPNGAAVVSTARNPGATTMTYDREIETLRTIVRDQGVELDPRTVAILENNLRVIEGAIGESRAALARDPGSAFLREQLNRALDKKLELLRTVALMRPRA
jgi:hypothetical protein